MSLHAHDIGFSYGPRFTLRVDSFSADAGRIVGIIGGNGSGKTTLIKILTGMLIPATGRVVLDGEPIGSYSTNRRARHLAYVSQSHRPAFEFTVEQTVLLGRMPYRSSYGGFENERDIDAAEEAIGLLELEALRYEPITNLSGGELQRVMIARAIAQGTGTLLLDEPNSHLDIAHQQKVLDIIRRTCRARGIAVAASIHDLNLASIFCDTIVAMSAGEVIGQGTPADVLNADLLQRAFGADLDVLPGIYGSSPAIRYRYHGEEASDV
jgi:ABC-type cobalamin/Fe3+-siderophores transport system ATPase subunit